MTNLANLPMYLTYDDVLLVPGYSDFSRDEITTKAKLTREIEIDIPLVAAPMDTVVEAELAIALGKLGGLGVIHRNLSVDDQAAQVKQARTAGVLVGAAIGVSSGYMERAEALVAADVSILLLDTAHGYTKYMIDAIKQLKQTFPKMQLIAGNIATYDGAKALIEAGADSLRVGMGPGAICTTRIISGMGVPQLMAVRQTTQAAEGTGVPVIADGGIKYSGDMVKGLAAGAGTVMMGSFFASCLEAPGQKVTLTRSQIPPKFAHLLKPGVEEYVFKSYRGMGSEGAMKQGAKIKSEDEFHGKSYQTKVLVAEGVEALVPVKGTVEDVVAQAMGGIKSGMYYVGAKNIQELQTKAEFMQITQASLQESHPHSLVITNSGKNY
jgi:IMP dehydrogenase